MIPIITLSYLFRFLTIILMFADFRNIPLHETKKENKGFALIELFTSEGCSSCPSADAAVAAIAGKNIENVYILGYHVDYWNYLGWKDEYSSKAFTDRQRNYGEVFELNSIYTPQVVINGETEFVGSDRHKLDQQITDALIGKNNLSVGITANVSSENKIAIAITLSRQEKNDEINIALVQRVAITKVKRGENSGKELKHINIVRELKTLSITTNSAEFEIPPGLTTKDVKIIAFIQDKKSLKINAAVENSL